MASMPTDVVTSSLTNPGVHTPSVLTAVEERKLNLPADEKQKADVKVPSSDAPADDTKAIMDADEEWQVDARNPRNWSNGKKWTAVSIASFYTFVSPLSSSIMAPALPDIAETFGLTSETMISMTLSIFLLSFGLFPMIYAPLSELETVGRKKILDISAVFFLAFNLACAFAPSAGALIGFRFLCGWFGSAPIAVGGGIISDLYSARDRAPAMAMYSLGPLIGPVIGPIAGGFLSQAAGWKWAFILVACLSGVAAAIGFPFLHETYAPAIRYRLAKQMDPEKAQYHYPDVAGRSQGSKDVAAFIWSNLQRPFLLLTQSLICFSLSLYMALTYGIYYLMFATFPDLFANVYQFSTGASGLAYIGLGLGFCTSTVLYGKYGNQFYARLVEKNNGVATPEMRVPAIIVGSLFIPVGLLWYGWSAQAHIHWIMPIIGTGIFGFGLMATYLPIQLYLVDAFQYAASALSAAAVARSMLGFAFPLFASQMFDAMGLGGGNTFLAALAILLGIPFPVWLWFRGEQLRARSSFTRS